MALIIKIRSNRNFFLQVLAKSKKNSNDIFGVILAKMVSLDKLVYER